MYRSQEKEGVRVVTAWQAGAAAPVEHPPEIKSRKTGILPLGSLLASKSAYKVFQQDNKSLKCTKSFTQVSKLGLSWLIHF